MPKRKAPNGQGTIRQRADGTWEGRVSIGRDPGTGKHKQKYFYGKTQAEVRKKMTAFSAELDNGVMTEPSKMTVGQWLDIWRAEYSGGIKSSTVDQYRTQVEQHLKPAFGAVKLDKLTAPMIQKLYNQKQRERKVDPKGREGLSAKSIKNLHGVLHEALERAVKLGYIKVNPCDACELPRIERHEIQPLTNEEIGKFLKAIRGHKYERLFTVMVFSGMRQGEALGLRWSCVDLVAGTIRVDRQLQKERVPGGGGDYHLVETKTSNIRTITLAPFVVEVLKAQKKAQAEQRLLMGPDWKNEWNLVFTHEDGGHLAAETTYKCFKRIAKNIGVEAARLHDLRHTFATLSLQNGDDLKTVADALGHSNISTTANIYAHVTERMRKESAARMENLIQSIK